MRMRRWAPYGGLAVALLVVWGGASVVLKAMASPAAVRDQKFQRAERTVYYRLNPGDTLTLDLAAQAHELRMLTHLVLPPDSEYAAERQFVYGLELKFHHPDASEAPTALFTRTRQSKALLKDGLWAQEHAFTLAPGTQIADGREFLVQVPDAAKPAPGTISLRYAGAQGALLVRVYGRYERLQSLFVRSEQLRRAENRVERATALPWEKLPAARQRQLSRVEWEPLNAQGEVGTDFEVETIYRTAFRLPLVDVAEAAQTYLAPGAGIAINVRGPATPTLRLWRASSWGAELAQDVEVHATAWDGSVQRWSVPRPAPGEVTARPLELSPGVHTLKVVNRADAELRWALEGEAATWFAPEAMKGPTQGTLALLPDLQRTDAYAVGPECAPAQLELPATRDTWGRLLRVDARAFLEAPAPGSVTLSLFDARGLHVGDTSVALTAEPAVFDSATLPHRVGGGLPCVTAGVAAAAPEVEATVRPVRISAAVSGKLFLPQNVHRVEVRGDVPALVSLFTFLPAQGEARLGTPYGESMPTVTRWSHAPIDRLSWHSIRPANHRELAAVGAEVTLTRQVRLEPSGQPSSDTSGAEALTLYPSGTPASLELFEPDPEVTAADAARSLFALLTPGEPLRVRFDARSPTRPELRLHLEGSGGLGHQVEIVVDGKVVRRHRLASTRSRALLPPIPSGVHEVVVRSHAPGLTAALNRAPAPNEASLAHRSRTLYRLGGGGLRVPVVKKRAGAETLNIVVYTPRAQVEAATRLQVTVDKGFPRRRTGVLVPRITRAVRLVEVAPTDRPAGSAAGRPGDLWHPRTFAVILAEDLAPGTHWVEIKPERPTALWARFFVYGDSVDEARVRQWNRPGWDVEEGP
ncbi:MAG: hypothetical protein M3Y59_12165 [Myxococcota bacterium]|nr:hypothetical protein [Myxococcota bacterium]